MIEPITITASTDDRLQPFSGMKSPLFRQRYEVEHDVFITEGIVAIGRLLRSPFHTNSVLLHPRMWLRMQDEITRYAPHAVVMVAEQPVLEAITGFDLHRGALACADRTMKWSLDELIGFSRLCVVEGLNDGENLGAIARSARAFGVGGLVIDPTTIDPLYRRTVRVSMGEILSLPFTRARVWPSALDDLRDAGFEVAAMTPSRDAVSLHHWRPTGKVAVLFGAEGPGLTEAAMGCATVRVRIPIAADVDSLNVGHAAAVTFAHLAAVTAAVR